MSEEDKEQATELSYFPDEIEAVRGKRGVYHVDAETGQRTYPSWAKRAERRRILPEDLDERRREPADEDEVLFHALCQAMHIEGYELNEGISTKPVVRAIERITGVKTFAAYRLLYGLWHAGLIIRTGRIYGQGGRPMHQEWYLEEPA
jgi:hypothetical protein